MEREREREGVKEVYSEFNVSAGALNAQLSLSANICHEENAMPHFFQIMHCEPQALLQRGGMTVIIVIITQQVTHSINDSQ